MTNAELLLTLKDVVETLKEGYPQTAELMIKTLVVKIECDESMLVERRNQPII